MPKKRDAVTLVNDDGNEVVVEAGSPAQKTWEDLGYTVTEKAEEPDTSSEGSEDSNEGENGSDEDESNDGGEDSGEGKELSREEMVAFIESKGGKVRKNLGLPKVKALYDEYKTE